MPDLNSVPPSPHSANARSRRESSNQMPPPSEAVNILPSNQSTVEQGRRSSTTSLTGHGIPHGINLSSSPSAVAGDATAGTGPGPLRHPRPLTAAELHAQLEKEQEAVVNRLTRELQLLRTAHNASTVSNASSTSAGAVAGSEHSAAATAPHPPPPDTSLLSGSGFSIPSSTGRRHTRTASNTSARSLAATLGSANQSTASIPIRQGPPPVFMSRQNSFTSHRSLSGTSPAADTPSASAYFHGYQRPPGHFPTGSQTSIGQGQDLPLSPGLMPVTSRYEESLHHREQYEAVLRENDGLKKRIRELEKQVRERQRSDSVSTTASVGAGTGAGQTAATDTAGSQVAGPRETRPAAERQRSMTAASVSSQSVAVGVPEDEVKVGESATNAGLPAGQQTQPS